jgi:hypothetical protein
VDRLCFYCARELDAAPDPEHVLPAALGTELVTWRVCTACNRRAGREVDQPWLAEPHVEESRRLLALINRRGRVAPPLRARGVLEDGSPALVTLAGDRVDIRRRPSRTVEGNVLRLSGYTEAEAERTWQRPRDRGELLGDPTTMVATSTALTATVRREVNVDIWPRFAAKVALAFISLFADDDWLVTDAAQGLRDVLWNGHPDTKRDALAHPGVAWSVPPLLLRQGTHPLRVGEHMLVCEETEAEGPWFCMVLFGDLLYRVPARVPWPQGDAPSCWFGQGNWNGRQLPSSLQWHLLTSREGGSAGTP